MMHLCAWNRSSYFVYLFESLGLVTSRRDRKSVKVSYSVRRSSPHDTSYDWLYFSGDGQKCTILGEMRTREQWHSPSTILM